MARITLIGKPGCHLCDDARAVVERVAAETGTAWEELSILDDPELREQYAEQIPVFWSTATSTISSGSTSAGCGRRSPAGAPGCVAADA